MGKNQKNTNELEGIWSICQGNKNKRLKRKWNNKTETGQKLKIPVYGLKTWIEMCETHS